METLKGILLIAGIAALIPLGCWLKLSIIRANQGWRQ